MQIGQIISQTLFLWSLSSNYNFGADNPQLFTFCKLSSTSTTGCLAPSQNGKDHYSEKLFWIQWMNIEHQWKMTLHIIESLNSLIVKTQLWTPECEKIIFRKNFQIRFCWNFWPFNLTFLFKIECLNSQGNPKHFSIAVQALSEFRAS